MVGYDTSTQILVILQQHFEGHNKAKINQFKTQLRADD